MMIFFAAAPSLHAKSKAETPTLRAMSFNIRYNNPGDGANTWPKRRKWAAEIIASRADIAGLQEARHDQMQNLIEDLDKFDHYGVGRDDAKTQGEYAPIFYRRDRFALKEKGVFWLSETPDKVGSQGWDASTRRIVTWVKLREENSGREFFVFNTHFDHRGEQARLESAKLLAQRLEKIAAGEPAFVLGDFNCTPGSPPYKVLTADNEADANSQLSDSRKASKSPPVGPDSTWNGFSRVVPKRRIDFVFVTPQWRVRSYAALDETRGGLFPSDHLPVVAELSIDQ